VRTALRGRSKKEPDHPARLLDTSHAPFPSRAIAAPLHPRSNPIDVFFSEYVHDPAAHGSISGSSHLRHFVTSLKLAKLRHFDGR
jgi:hypothetical protein